MVTAWGQVELGGRQAETERMSVGRIAAARSALGWASPPVIGADGSKEGLAVARVHLVEVEGAEDRLDLLGLRRGPDQEQYLNSMEDIFAEADAEQRAMPHPWAVHDAVVGGLVGFVMISDNIPEPIDDDLVGPYFLWKLLVDASHQGKGYGSATVDAVVGYLRTRPGADVLYTSCADGPGSPRGFYLRYGFADIDRVMWGENVLALELTSSGSPAS